MLANIRDCIKKRPDILYLLYFPVYSVAYMLVERYTGTVTDPIVSYMPLDDLIPFCEYFVIPYFLWFAYMLAAGLLVFVTDAAAFRRMMWLYILGFSLGIGFCALFPSVQLLRPETFPRDNFFTDIVRHLYSIDNNATVLPSLHVVGALVAATGLFFSRWRSNIPLQLGSWAMCVLITLATVFTKQHSVHDVFAALVFFAPILALVLAADRLYQKKIRAS